MPDIIWEAPPPTARMGSAHKGKYADIARALRDPENEDPDAPGKSRWARLPQDSPPRAEKTSENLAANIRRGINSDFRPKGAFETAIDGVEIWVRYIGEPPPEEPKPPRSSEGQDNGQDGGQDGSEGGQEGHEGQPPARPEVNPAEVRAWARNNGFHVPDRGRLPQNVIDAYKAAQRPRHLRAAVTAE